jgi:hypothetical protein
MSPTAAPLPAELAPKTLRDFVVGVLAKGPLSLSEFMELRYWVLYRAFPHDIFSVGQGTTDFFQRLLSHLDGAPFEKMENPSVYEMNYRRWVLDNR